MSEWTFWLIMLAIGALLWWFAYYATARMRHGKNQEREEQAKRNLERYAQEQAAEQEKNEIAEKSELVEKKEQH
ncbi:MAG: hypothetical protein ACE5E3_00140 [Mariprofundus sp.]